MNKTCLILKLNKNTASKYAYLRQILNKYGLSLNFLILLNNNENNFNREFLKTISYKTYILNFNSFDDEVKNKIIEIMKDENVDYIISTSDTLDFIAKISVKLDIGILTDINHFIPEGENFYSCKYAYGGNYLAYLGLKSKPNVIVFSVLNDTEDLLNLKEYSSGEGEIIEINFNNLKKIELVKSEKVDDVYDLTKAKKVVGVGRGVRYEDIQLIKKFAEKIGASIGYTRPVIYDGIAPKDYQIGITGKIISPQLYIAIGISGKDYHIKGVEKARKIIAVNKDPEAPISKYSDYFIPRDYRDVIPKLL